MKQTPGTSKDAADRLVRGIKRKTRKHYSAEEKIRIVLAGLRGETRDFRTLRRDRGTEWRSLRFCDIGSGGFVIGCKILAALGCGLIMSGP
ncbi:MAG: hypothetical protein NXH96_19785 [Alteromonadaceae bacterium]|nr:hypothetical protein [Alteromonadaceae bacterium]